MYVTKEFISKVSFPLVGNPSEERLRTSRSDKLGSNTYALISKGSLNSNFLKREVL